LTSPFPDAVPPAPVFLTGSSGFIGRSVVRRLARSGHPDVRLLVRAPLPRPDDDATPSGWRRLEGRLEQPGSWASQLQGVETVVHLAAATGKVSRKAHFRVTLEGTRRLLELCRDAGVRRFLFVSSNAVTYRDRPQYHYADAKAAAESLVRAARLDHLIVRPTLVLGPGSPLLASLRRLALLPVPLFFGSGEHAVQPIHVEDLAELLAGALSLSSWQGRAITAGGPERIRIADLMSRIRAAARGDRPHFRHLPLELTRTVLGLLEPLLLPLLPFTAGQLAFFANPSVVEPDPLLIQLPAPTRDLAAMLSEGGGP
jgi:nucleoside-diphosphate-sugar epimerase